MFQEAVELPNVIKKESGCSFHCDCCVRWNEVYSLSQKVTYLFCDELKIVSKELMSRVRQATKDVVKSEV